MASAWRPTASPSRSRFELAVDASDIVPVTELIVENYKEVGINASMKVVEGIAARRALQRQRAVGQRALEPLARAVVGRAVGRQPRQLGPPVEELVQHQRRVGRRAAAKRSKSSWTWSTSRSSSTAQEREEAIAAWKKMMYDNLYVIVTVEHVKYPLIVNKKLRNVPTSGFAIAANFSLEQLYFES